MVQSSMEGPLWNCGTITKALFSTHKTQTHNKQQFFKSFFVNKHSCNAQMDANKMFQ